MSWIVTPLRDLLSPMALNGWVCQTLLGRRRRTRSKIQSIQNESIKPGSQDTNIGLPKRQIAPQSRKVISTYTGAITKNKYELTKMGFTTDYTFLVHHLKFHLKKFSQTPQGTSFTKLIKNWDATAASVL